MIQGPVLALDSSTSTGSVAVGDRGGILAEVVRNVAGGHSAALLPAVDQAMQAAGLQPAELGAIVVGEGPGSFTGLRIAGATAKGMLQALRIPLFAYSGLLATAAAGWSSAGPVCALFDARRRDVFAACYRFDRGRSVEVLMEPSALSLDELIDRFAGEGEPPLFVGEGAGLHAQELRERLRASIGPPHLAMPRASALVWLALTQPRAGLVEDPSAWEPEYLRASGAERIAAERASGGGT